MQGMVTTAGTAMIEVFLSLNFYHIVYLKMNLEIFLMTLSHAYQNLISEYVRLRERQVKELLKQYAKQNKERGSDQRK